MTRGLFGKRAAPTASRPARRRLTTAAVIALCATTLGATAGLTWNARTATGPEAARAIREGSDSEQLQAIVAARAEAARLIAALEHAAQGEGDAAAQAKIALEQLRRRLR